MRQTFFPLRLVLLLVAACNLYVAWIFLFAPETVSLLYKLPPPTGVQQYLTMTVGALIGVFGIGALLPVIRPLRYGAIIIMLLLMHFSIFLIDVIVLSRGLMDWKLLAPEMLYFLVVSTALVRWYPLSLKEPLQVPAITKEADGTVRQEE